jgi:thioredoxin reductase
MVNIAIIGAGPYGLSMAAHLRHRGISFRIFGRPMDSWLGHMPKGMLLKSDGFASNIYDPDGNFTLQRFCSEQGIPYADTGLPVRLDTFAAYGLAFRERMVPDLEDTLVVSLDRASSGFRLGLEGGEEVMARRVVLAVGITHFEYLPPSLAHLPREFLSHSFCHHNLEPFRGRSVAVIGGGASAIDLTGLLQEVGAEVQLVARQTSLRFHSAPKDKPRSRWQRIRHPQSGLGPGLRSRFFSDAPNLFHHLPERLRLEIVRRALGPSGGWFAKEKLLGRVPILLGYRPQRAEIHGGRVHLQLCSANGDQREVLAEHVIAATGYRVDTEKLTFLSTGIRSQFKTVAGAPVLSSAFESSVPGLYFVGVAAANSFGPLMRFAFGAGFAAGTVTRTMMKAFSSDLSTLPATGVMNTAK